MKKGIIAIALVAVLGLGGVGGYTVYQKKVEEKKYEKEVSDAIAKLPTISIYEKEDLPSVEDEFAGVGDKIKVDSVQPDISNVYATEPGTYDVKYTFEDTKGQQRTATVKCEVKPELASHVVGMKNIEIDKGDDIPTEADCTFDEYVNSVTLDTENVDNLEAGVYDISYTIIGADGDMKTVDGYTCTVNEVATPTPSPTPKPTATPEPTKAPEPTAKPDESENQEQEAAVGNVEVQKDVVETGDENNILAIVVLLVACLGAAGGVFVYKKKQKDK